MEQIIPPKKERKFLKAIGKIGKSLVEELVMGIGRKFIGNVVNKIKFPNKNNTFSLFLLLSCTFAFAQYPATGNKQRLGYQTTGDGLVFRGRSADTVSLKPSTINNAYHLFDTVNNVLFSFIKTKGGWKFNNSDTVIIQGVTMPFDSITFNTAKDGAVGVGEVEYNDTQGSLIQGLKGGNVTNVIGQQLHQRVSNVTGSTLSKGTAVYLSGSQGNRITAAKALAISDPTSANTFGIVAESIADNASGYVITEGLITGINTSGLTEDSAVYLSPTVAGGLTSTKPQAPNHGVYIGVCVKSNAGSGELFVKIKNGLELDELHDVLITSPASNASLYYKSSEGIWRDTTAALLVSDTATMLTNYLRSGVAASTYLPLTGGTLTGALNGTTGTFTGLNINNGTYSGSETGSFKIKGNTNINKILEIGLNETNNYGVINVLQGGVSSYPLILNNSGGRVGINTLSPNINLTIEGKNNTKYNNSTFWNFNFVGQEIYNNSDTINSISGIAFVNGSSRNSVSGIGGWSESNNLGALSFFTGGSGKSNQVTEAQRINSNGEAIFFQPFFTKSSAVFNDDSNDADFRVESDGNANMVFVDASTNRVGIGTATPSKTLDVVGDANVSGNLTEGGNNVMTNLDTVSLSNRINGKVGLTGDDIISGTKTFNSLVNLASNLILSGSYSQTNKLLGKNSSDGVGNITVGSGLNLTSDVLTATQIDTTSLSNRIDLKLNKTDTASLSNRINNKVGLTGNETIAGEKTLSNILILNGGLKGQIEKKSGSTVGSFDAIDATTITYIFEHTGSGTGSVILEYLDNPSNHTNRIINIINVSDNDWDMTFDTRKPYIKTSTQINQVEYGQSITVQSDGSKWWVISRNF